MELLNTQHRPEIRTIKHIIFDLQKLYNILRAELGSPPEENPAARYLLCQKRKEFEDAHNIIAPDYASLDLRLNYKHLIFMDEPQQDLGQFRKAIFLFERQLRESGVYKYNFMDIDPPQPYSIAKYLHGQINWAKKIIADKPDLQAHLRRAGFVVRDPFPATDTEIYGFIEKHAARRAVNPHFAKPEKYIGPAVGSGGKLQMRMMGTGITCWSRDMQEYVADNTPTGWHSFHTYQIAEEIAPLWPVAQKIFASIPAKWRSQTDYFNCEYYIPLMHVSILIMFEIVRQSSANIILWICDDRIWRTSLGLVSLGKYLSNWTVDFVFESRVFTDPSCFIAKSFFPRQDIMTAQYLYFLFGHRVYRAGRRIDLPAYMTRAELHGDFDAEHMAIIDKYCELWKKYSEDYARCILPEISEEEKKQLAEAETARLLRILENYPPGESKLVMLIAAPGTGKTTIANKYRDKGYFHMSPNNSDHVRVSGMNREEAIEFTRAQLNADFDKMAETLPPTLAGLHGLLQNTLSLQARACKMVFRKIMWKALSDLLIIHRDRGMSQNILIENSTHNTYIPRDIEYSPELEIIYLHTRVENTYSQHLRRSKEETRMKDYYGVIQLTNESAESYLHYLEIGKTNLKFIHMNTPDDIIELPGGNKSQIQYSPLLEESFKKILDKF